MRALPSSDIPANDHDHVGALFRPDQCTADFNLSNRTRDVLDVKNLKWLGSSEQQPVKERHATTAISRPDNIDHVPAGERRHGHAKELA
ncbi:hypothetical protein SMC6_00885 [Candidatus Cryosericum odellii]|uniref:Uncharacterized protein n=1 Tax=Candidatus Cryosericum odellii TaxID=2290917 RepID=A0A398DI72_9BACT|nr:hypothetical protein SMC6_00885 [Candidatus Cryosericum odellii]